MGIFTGIGLVTPDATRYKKAIRSLERYKSKMMITSAKNAIAFRKQEDPREHSMLMHSMWGRGLGKSSIFDQQKERLQLIQDQRNEMLKLNLRYARQYKTYIDRKHHWEKINQYYEMIDGIIGLASGATGSASTTYSGGGGGGSGFDAASSGMDTGMSWASGMGMY